MIHTGYRDVDSTAPNALMIAELTACVKTGEHFPACRLTSSRYTMGLLLALQNEAADLCEGDVRACATCKRTAHEIQ
jgi:hypothetical protein